MANSCPGYIALPPSFKYHILEGNAPSIFYWYWGIGSVCCVVTCIITIPRVYQLRAAALEIRDSKYLIMTPIPFTLVALIVIYPLVVVWLSLLTQISPIVSFTSDLCISMYSAVVLYLFARLLIMYLGSFQAASATLKRNAPKTKFYAAMPCCCLRRCVPSKRMTEHDFRKMYYLIQQHMLLLPLFKFLVLFPVFFPTEGETSAFYGHLTLLSSLLCIWGCQALLTASKDILSEYQIVGKFRVIQIAVLSLTVPKSVIDIFGGMPRVDVVYSPVVMTEALVSCINCVVFTQLSFGYRHFFTERTAHDAYRNLQHRSFSASMQVAGAKDEDDSDQSIYDGMKHVENGNNTENVRLQDEEAVVLRSGNSWHRKLRKHDTPHVNRFNPLPTEERGSEND